MNDPERNRRLFGSLMGHLQKAKKQSADDGDKLAKRKAKTQIVVDKDHKRALVAQRDVVREKAEHFIAREERLAKYLITSTTPEVYWMPSVRSDAMERLYEARKGEVEKRLRARELADAEVTDTIDEKIRTIDERIKEYGDDATTATHGGDNWR